MHQLGGYPIPDQFEDTALISQTASRGLACKYDSPPAELPTELEAGASDWMFFIQFDTGEGDRRSKPRAAILRGDTT